MKYNFDLNEAEIKTLEEWIEKIPKKYKDMDKIFCFSRNSGIGQNCIVKIGNKEKDITDYSCW